MFDSCINVRFVSVRLLSSRGLFEIKKRLTPISYVLEQLTASWIAEVVFAI